jgi:hypothetical protein
MEINLNLEKFSDKLTQIAQASYPESGNLKSSIRVSVTEDQIVISFANYGLFQDGGVQGAFGTRNPSGRGYDKRIFQYKKETDRFGRPKPVGGNLPYGARVNIRKFGIPAKPWIAKMLNNLSDEIAKEIEIELPAFIEAEIARLIGTIK